MNNIVCFTFSMMSYQTQPTIIAKTIFFKFFCVTLRKFSKKLSFYVLSLKLVALNVWSDIISPKTHFDLIYFKTMWVGFLFLMAKKKLPHNNIHLKSVWVIFYSCAHGHPLPKWSLLSIFSEQQNLIDLLWETVTAKSYNLEIYLVYVLALRSQALIFWIHVCAVNWTA